MGKKITTEIENRLTDAAGQMIPDDMFERITQNIAYQERTIKMDNNNTAKKNFPVARWVSIAACVLLVCGLFGTGYYLENFKVDSVVNIDINPGIEITTNKNNRVIDVTAINRDAERVLDGMDLKKTDLKVTVNAIIGAMVKNGYLTDGDNSILVSVKNDHASRATHVRNLVMSDINNSLKGSNIELSIVNQTLTENNDAAKLAKDQGISLGKAAFILNLCAKDSTLDAAKLASMKIKDIAAIVNEKNIDIRDIVDYDADDSIWGNIKDTVEDINEDAMEINGKNKNKNENTTSTNDSQLITAEKAKEIALKDASIDKNNTSYVKCELDCDDGVQEYEIEFTVNGSEFKYEIDAATGAITHSSRKTNGNSNVDSGNQKNNVISPARAKEIALKHAGIAKDASFIKVELDHDDGIHIYEVEFLAGNTEYEYEVDAVTGKVISFASELDY